MTEDMPRQLPKYVYRERNRHGNYAFYFRKEKGRRTRLPDYGAEDFDARYRDALLGMAPEPKRATPHTGTLAWLIEAYRETSAYTSMSMATRRQRDNIFLGVKAKDGTATLPIRAMTRGHIETGLADRAATPHQARHFLDTMRGLFAWAVKAGHATANPTHDVEYLPRPPTDGFAPWTDADVAAYEKRWKAGTRQRVWMHVLLYTGVRRGDAVRLGRQHVRHGVATIRTEKTGTEVSIPVRDELAATLRDGPVGELAYVTGESGKPLTKESFGNMFKDACVAAGVTKSAHGLRKLAAIRAAEAGATVDELDALFGWSGGRTSSIYTRKANRQRLAKRAMEKIVNAERPHLEASAPHPEKLSATTKA